MCPYNQTDTRVHGFIGTHQPAVWMGESGPVQVAAGLGEVVTDFERRGMEFKRRDEYASQNYYSNVLSGPGGIVEAEMTASECIDMGRDVGLRIQPRASGTSASRSARMATRRRTSSSTPAASAQ